MQNYNEKKQAVRELLMKYTDPKPEFTGMSAHEIAVKIMAIVQDLQNPDEDISEDDNSGQSPTPDL